MAHDTHKLPAQGVNNGTRCHNSAVQWLSDPTEPFPLKVRTLRRGTAPVTLMSNQRAC